VTLEFIGPLLVAVGSKRFVDYLWVLLAAAGIVLIAPWTNNGINVLGVLFALLQELFGFYIVLGGKYQNNEDGCCNWNALCLIVVLLELWEMDSVI
jgi:threonine/homoserine efflux transporter RhtA